jgi:hypothetical protein
MVPRTKYWVPHSVASVETISDPPAAPPVRPSPLRISPQPRSLCQHQRMQVPRGATHITPRDTSSSATDRSRP